MGDQEQHNIEGSIVCPTCGEVYRSRKMMERLLANVNHCINLTCLTDLNEFPIDKVWARVAPARRHERIG